MSENILEIKNWKFKYPGTKKDKWHLHDVSLDVERGKWTSIIGPNGSGKSTLAKSIVRINKTKHGKIFVEGKDIHEYKGKEFAKKVAYIPQSIDIPHGTPVYDFISFGRNPYLGITGRLSKKDKNFIESVMKSTDTWQWKDKMMEELSGGQRQKVLIAMIIVQDAEVILLDEPTTYLDIRNQYELLEMMHYEHEKGKTIITILHDINQATQYSDKIYVMKEGKIYNNGTPEKVIDNKSLKDVYGVDAKLYKDGNRKYVTDVKLVDFKYGGEHEHHEHKRKEVHTKDTKH